MASVVNSKGQIIIEKPIRDALGLQPGYVAVQKLVGDHIEISFYPPEHEQSLRGILASEITTSVPVAGWSQARLQAWSDTTREHWDIDNGR